MSQVKSLDRAYVIPAEPTPRGTLTGGVFSGSASFEATSGLTRGGRAIVAAPPQFAPPEAPNEMKREALFAGYVFGDFGTFVLESCARLWAAVERPDLPILWLNARSLTRWQRDILAALNVANRSIFVVAPMRVESLLVPEPGFRDPDWLDPHHAAFLAAFEGPKATPRKVWLSRAHLPAAEGRIFGEAQLQPRLGKGGWTVNQPDRTELDVLLTTLSGAEHVAGFSGGAFAALALLKNPPQRVTLFGRGASDHGAIETIARARGMDLTVLEAPAADGRADGSADACLTSGAPILDALKVPIGDEAKYSTDPDARPRMESTRRINALLERSAQRRYLEIGVADGQTFLNVEADHKVAVDPRFRFDYRHYASPSQQFYELPSDQYFQFHSGTQLFDVMFIDGLHTFEQTFRDFCASLRHAHAKTVWVIDDTVPSDIYSGWPNPAEAVRFRKEAGGQGTAWHGDVFKVVYAIHDFFPTMSFATIVGGGNPQTVVWWENRTSFTPVFDSLEAISKMTWFEMQLHKDAMKRQREDVVLERVFAALAA